MPITIALPVPKVIRFGGCPWLQNRWTLPGTVASPSDPDGFLWEVAFNPFTDLT
jgi:hypothetical protein